MEKDRLYQEKRSNVRPFEFNQEVVQVFDDMLNRSIPQYQDVNRFIGQLAPHFVAPGERIYDIGCSIGNTIQTLLQESWHNQARLIGIDNSEAMIAKCRELFNEEEVELHCCPIEDFPLKDHSLAVLNYTLQFIAGENRRPLLQKIYDNLRPGGALVLSEKIRHSDTQMESLLTGLYYQFKKTNGYTETEIAQKRQALKNVLVPCTLEEHRQRLAEIGFRSIEIIYKWYNFSCLLAIK